MRRVVAALLAIAALVSCNRQHPISVHVDPRFEASAPADRAVNKIAVMRFASSLNHSDDPDGVAPRLMEKYLEEALAERGDYSFIAPGTVDYAVTQIGWADRYERFLKSYAMTDKPDLEFLGGLTKALQCDAYLISVVDLWQKDEVDMQENSTPATYVGATITVVAADDGTTLFRATDEDYLEGARSETTDRSLVTSASGAVYADLGKKLHRAPPFEDVAVKVARQLVASLPAR